MLYINDPKQTYLEYHKLAQVAIDNGVEPKRIYIYLAALGVKSAMLRAIDSSGVGYLDAVKVAVKDGKVIASVSICECCKGLVFNG